MDETRDYLLEDIKHNNCVSIFAFASLACVHIGIVSSAVRIKICAIIAGGKTMIKQSY